MKSDTEEVVEEGYQPLVPYIIRREDAVSVKVPDDAHDAGTSELESESAAEYIDLNKLGNELVELLPAKPSGLAPVSNGIDKSPSSEANESDTNESDDHKVVDALVDNNGKNKDEDYKDDNDDKDNSNDGEQTTVLNNSISEMHDSY